MQPSFLPRQNGQKLAYHQHLPTTASGPTTTSGIGIIFLGGFKSDMNGSKALFFHEWAQRHNHPFIRFDYHGHGQSSGNFTDGTIGHWLSDTLAIIDQLTTTPQLLIGSSLGGWLALLAAKARPKRIAALMTIANATDFTEELIWQKFDEKQRQELQQNGQYQLPSNYCNDPNTTPDPYIITKTLIAEARQHLLLAPASSPKIDITCPITLIHGLLDQDVPASTSARLAAALTSPNIRHITQPNGDHRMSSPASLALLNTELIHLLQKNP